MFTRVLGKNDQKNIPNPFFSLFLGCRIISVAPGTKLVSKNVTYSTTQRTGLTVGCYRVKEPDKAAERILVIKDDQNGGDPVVGKVLDDIKIIIL